MENLPCDVEEIILDMAAYGKCPPSNMSAVCKKWRRYLYQESRCSYIGFGRLLLCTVHHGPLITGCTRIMASWCSSNSSLCFVHACEECCMPTLVTCFARLKHQGGFDMDFKYFCCGGEGICIMMYPSYMPPVYIPPSTRVYTLEAHP